MNGMTGRVYQALQGMGAVVTRGWPQADVPAPSVAYAQTISAWDEASGLHRYGYRLTVRAAAPEDCDAAAQEADGRMRALGFARRACFDGAEGNGGSFLKTMDYEGLFGAEGLPPPAPRAWVSTAAGEVAVEQVVRVALPAQTRAMADITEPGDGAKRYAPGPLDRGTLRLAFRRMPGAAGQELVLQAFDAAGRLTLRTDDMTAAGYVERLAMAGGTMEADIRLTD
ncbi:MAG: hypothetical protein GX625_17765 [Clostridiaceae bacterium]|nr:hypothetical protein [Clostridiaceae bacterium]